MHNDALVLARMRALEQAAQLSTDAHTAAAFARAPRVVGLTRTRSAPLPLHVLHQQSLMLQRQQEELLRHSNPRHYIKKVSSTVVSSSA